MSDDARELAHQLAHELRGPLMGIKGLSSTASSLYDQLSDAERREFFGLIDSEAGRLAKVAEQAAILLLLQADELPMHPERFDLNDLVSDTVATDTRIERTEAAPTEVYADPTRVRQIIESLLENARRYSPGPIAVSSEIEGGVAVLTVVDDGPGLGQAQRERAFERLSTVRPPGYEDQPGAGLDLFLARTHARAMGGELTMMAAAQGGTIMTLTLPLEG